MKKEVASTCLGVSILLALSWLPNIAQAQQTSWWEQQKAKNEQAAAAARAQSVPVQNEAQPAAPPATVSAPAYAPVTTAKAAAESPSYSYIEGGVGRLDVDMYGVNENGNGGYVRGSAAVTNNLYLFAGYDRAQKSWSQDTEKLSVAINQTEIGFGTRLPLSASTDFISELSLVRLDGDVDYSDTANPLNNLDGTDHLNAGKLMLGIRARPASSLELWLKGGYLRVDENFLIDNSGVGNIGFQYRFTPNFGLVGEAEFYKDVRFYRLGIRASF
jgi:hypothetical protein